MLHYRKLYTTIWNLSSFFMSNTNRNHTVFLQKDKKMQKENEHTINVDLRYSKYKRFMFKDQKTFNPFCIEN